MSKIVSSTKENIKEIIENAVKKAILKGDLPEAELTSFSIEVPADRTHGDFAVNAAMVWTKLFKTAPRNIATAIVENAELEGTFIQKAEIAGPGFINLFLKDSYYAAIVEDVLEKGDDYGNSDLGKGKSVMVEFVSANPTGPMHIGNARGGALGDCLAAVLKKAGYDVTREFYVNDAGNQIAKFGASLEARYLQIYKPETEFPEDGYQGADIIDRAKEFAEIHGDSFVNKSEEERREALVNYALPLNIEGLKNDLLKYRIDYDVWFKESSLYESGAIDDVLKTLGDKGLLYEKDGATWYKATEFGGEKDEVLVRANGNPTYFAGDIAYHYNKFAVRKFDKVINVWGADHHGHVARLKGAMNAVGCDGDQLDIVLMQLVRLVRDGEVVRVSKRTGKSITLKSLLDEVPLDAARFIFNSKEPNTHLEFDLDLAVEQSSQNPVYYVQYAHARICSILRNLNADGIKAEKCSIDTLCKLTAMEEKELIRHISELTGEIEASAKSYDSARITRYVLGLATLFHKFYNACRVKNDDCELMQARISLCVATKTVIANVLSMLKISAPENM
jgi:arginyl-tRNA synthetase